MISSPTEREMSRIILSLKPLKNKCMISGLLVRVRSPSREKSEDVEILETHKERRTFSEPQVDESATGEAPAEISITEAISIGVTLPKTDPTVAEATALGVSYTKAAQGMMISTKVATAVTSAPPSNDHNSSFSNHFLYDVFDFEALAETPALTAPNTGHFKRRKLLPS